MNLQKLLNVLLNPQALWEGHLATALQAIQSLPNAGDMDENGTMNGVKELAKLIQFQIEQNTGVTVEEHDILLLVAKYEQSPAFLPDMVEACMDFENKVAITRTIH